MIDRCVSETQLFGKVESLLRVYDPAMCCSTGVCGTSVDPALVLFAADIAWLKTQGIPVRRFNLSQEPEAFLAEPLVASGLQDEGFLPVAIVGDMVLTQGKYPDRQTLAHAFGLPIPSTRKALNVIA